MLYITYEEYKTSTITKDSKVELLYYVDYYQDTTKAKNALLVFFILANILAAIIVIFKIRNFLIYNPKETYVRFVNG